MLNSGLPAYRKLDKRSLRTRQALSKGLFSLLEFKEFRRISVNEICAAARVSRPTFYTYFEDKYSLLNYCIGTVFRDLLSQPMPPGSGDRQRMELTADHFEPYRRAIANCVSADILLSGEGDSLSVSSDGKLPLGLVGLCRLCGPLAVFCWWSMCGEPVSREDLIGQLTEMLDEAQRTLGA